MLNQHDHHCECEKCKRTKERKYFKHKDHKFHGKEDRKDMMDKKHRGHKWPDHEESDDWRDRKHKDHYKEHDYEESDNWKHNKHHDHKSWDHEESDDWNFQKPKDCNRCEKHHIESDDSKDKKHKDFKQYDSHESDDWDSKRFEVNKSCVCEKVRAINEAQHKVARKKLGCDVSCERSIKELLNNCEDSKLDTIPFKLICGCAGECETFVGTGVININGCFFDIRSSFFRVVDFIRGSDCCAILELLCPERCEENSGIKGFVKTGACFEVDLNDFTGITCFPPVAAKKMDPTKLLNTGNKKKRK